MSVVGKSHSFKAINHMTFSCLYLGKKPSKLQVFVMYKLLLKCFCVRNSGSANEAKWNSAFIVFYDWQIKCI